MMHPGGSSAFFIIIIIPVYIHKTVNYIEYRVTKPMAMALAYIVLVRTLCVPIIYIYSSGHSESRELLLSIYIY